MKGVKWKRKYIEYMLDILGMICLSYVILFFVDMSNEVYQTLRNIYAAKAIFMFAAFMFIIQRVRLFNWQSLVSTLIYLPLGYMYRNRYIMAPDYFERDKIVVCIVWLLLMIAVDMAVYKKVNVQQNMNGAALTIFVLMTVFITFYRNGRTYPFIFFVMFLFYLIPLSLERWKRILYQSCGAWILSFVRLLIRSFKVNPGLADNGRWYGCFMNIGDFGVFVGAVIMIILYLLYVSKHKYGRKSIPYAAGWILLLVAVWTAARICTLTMFVGIACAVFVSFVIMPRKDKVRYIVFRAVLVILSLVVIVMGGFWLLRTIANLDQDYWTKILKEGNTFVKPFADLVRRAHVVFDKPVTYGDSNIFEIGSTLNYIDLITSGRLSIMKAFSEYFNFTGNTSFGVEVGTYHAFSAHNTYAQMIFEYGYIGGGLFFVWFGSFLVFGAKKYLRERSSEMLLICLWAGILIGVFLGEYVMIYSAVMFMAFFLNYPLIVNLTSEEMSKEWIDDEYDAIYCGKY